jgi:hypothetical protein
MHTSFQIPYNSLFMTILPLHFKLHKFSSWYHQVCQDERSLIGHRRIGIEVEKIQSQHSVQRTEQCCHRKQNKNDNTSINVVFSTDWIDISTFGRVKFSVDGQEAPLWEWCATHTNDITSVGMVLNKLVTAPLWEWCATHTNDITSVGMALNKLITALLWEWCSDSQNLCRSSVQYGLLTALLWQYCSVSTDSPSLGNIVQHNLTPSKELAQYSHTKGVL